MPRWLIGLASAALVLIALIGLAVPGLIYSRYALLEVYEWTDGVNSNVMKDGILYVPNLELSQKIIAGEIVPGQVVGRFKGDPLIGPKSWVIQLEGVDVRDGFMVRGLMFEGEYMRQQ